MNHRPIEEPLAAITAVNVHKRYGRHEVLDGIDLEVHAGKITLLVGPNGAGKTTTMGVLAGLVRPHEGMVRINGKDILAKRLEAQKELSFLPQGVSFHPRLSCRELLLFYARLRGIGRDRVEHVLDLAGLQGHVRKPAGKLSGGLRQRLGLALLLLPDASVLLLDEPGLSLDHEWRARMLQLLQEEAQNGKTVLVTTHLVAEWDGVAERCLYCSEGRIAGELDPGNLRQVFSSRPATSEPWLLPHLLARKGLAL